MGRIVVPLGGVVAALVLSIVYAFVNVYSPFVGYLSLVLTAGLVVGIGFLIGRLALVTKCRNPGFLRLVGLSCGILALYSSWAAFEYVLFARYDESFDFTMVDLFISPAAVWYVAMDINKSGWYSVFGSTPSGMLLWFFWGVEAIMIVAGPAILATMELETEVFCESCNRWCAQSLDAVRLTSPDSEENFEKLRTGNVGLLQTLRPAQPDVYPFLSIDTWQCESCNQMAAMQAKLYTVETDSEGEVTEKIGVFTPIVLTDPAVLVKITDTGRDEVLSS